MLKKIENYVEDFFNTRPILRIFAASLAIPFFLCLYAVQSILFAIGYFCQRLDFLSRTYIWMWATVVRPKSQVQVHEPKSY